ncbi:MAG: transporter substrate-binding domain-containing protein [Magnetococcales bacterium]|nr:transporter substrate-binding domain-containing protein [Magnetococcales bacterium]
MKNVNICHDQTRESQPYSDSSSINCCLWATIAHSLKVLLASALLITIPTSTLAQEHEERFLFLGNHNISPMIFIQNGKPVGLVIDLVRALVDKAGLNADIQAMDWSKAQSMVQYGTADALLQINRSSEREKIYDFSTELLKSSFSIFRKNTRLDIQNIESLSGLTVGVEQQGYPAQLLKKYPQINVKLIPSWKVGFELINSDVLDAVIVDRWVGEYELYLHNIHGIVVVDKPVKINYSAIAVKKGNEQLLHRINEGLEIIRNDGTMQKILDNWRKREIVYLTKREYGQAIIIFSISLISLVLLAIVVIYSNKLRKYRSQLEEKVLERTAELREANFNLRKSNEMAKAANLAKSSFLTNMSHELRTPLNAILGFSQIMVRNSSITPEQKENLEIIYKSGSHLLELINDILEISKIGVHKTSVHPSSFDLYNFLQKICDIIQIRANEKGLELILTIDSDVPRHVQTDDSKLHRILFNLLSNAVKFTNQGNIALRVWRPQNPLPEVGDKNQYLLSFEVEDSGIGISEEEIEHLFDPFMQTESGIASGEGAGLGLPISKNFVELLGGSISVKSKAGVGSTFYFDIKVEKADKNDILSQKLVRRVVGLQPDQPTKRILVVEYKRESRMLLTRLLGSIGCQVREAINAQGGLEQFMDWHPHLIFLDMHMPAMDSFDAARTIKARTSGRWSTTIIAVIASIMEEEENTQIIAAGCDDFIRRPLRERDIFDVLYKHLGMRFIYEEEPSADGTDKPRLPEEDPLSPDALSKLPEALKKKLNHAAFALDVEETMMAIMEIRTIDTDLADLLSSMVQKFEYGKIQAWLEKER